MSVCFVLVEGTECTSINRIVASRFRSIRGVVALSLSLSPNACAFTFALILAAYFLCEIVDISSFKFSLVEILFGIPFLPLAFFLSLTLNLAVSLRVRSFISLLLLVFVCRAFGLFRICTNNKRKMYIS